MCRVSECPLRAAIERIEEQVRSLSDELRNARRCESELFECLREELMGPDAPKNPVPNRNKRPRVSSGMQSVHRFLTSDLHADKLVLSRGDLHLGLTTQLRFYYETYRQYLWGFYPLDPVVFDESSMVYFLSRVPDEACPLSLCSTIAVCMGNTINPALDPTRTNLNYYQGLR